MNLKRTTVEEYAALAQAKYGRLEMTRAEIFALNAEAGCLTPFRLRKENAGSKRGYFAVPVDGNFVAQPKVVASVPVSAVLEAPASVVQNVVAPQAIGPQITEGVIYIPEVDPTYVSWGNSGTLDRVIRSKQFYPVFITGMSGNGKTFGVEQACARAKREYIRVNITVETDEDDLLGGMRLVNGETVFQEGPVVEAMRRGAILLLDEIDLASSKIMCLQPVLEGKPIYLKKGGRYVVPAAGFNILATANTKGKGSPTGHFVGTQVLNEAFLDRFPVMVYQPYPDAPVETKILHAASGGLKMAANEDTEYAVKVLVKWAEKIRSAYDNGIVPDTMTTRRLVNILKGMTIFGGKGALNKSVELAVERFDDDTKKPFLDFFKAVSKATEEEIKSALEEAARLKAQQEALNSAGDIVGTVNAGLAAKAAEPEPAAPVAPLSADPALNKLLEELRAQAQKTP